MKKSHTFFMYSLRMSENYCAFRFINWQHESQDKSLRKVTYGYGFQNAYGFQCSNTSVFTAHITFNAHQYYLVLKFA